MPVRALALLFAAALFACPDSELRPTGNPDAGAPSCGDGRVDRGEECDGSDLAGNSCTTLGFNLGSVSCDPQCRLVTTGCVKLCGNGRLDPGEVCDGAAGALTCADWGYKVCSPTCTVDSLHCRANAFRASPAVQQAYGGPAIIADLTPRGPGDLVIPDTQATQLQLYKYVIIEGFVEASALSRPDGIVPQLPIAADLDGDGHVDLAAINRDGSADRYLYIPPGQPLPDGGAPANFGRYAVQPLGGPTDAGTPCPIIEWIGAAKLDGDGASDLAALACPAQINGPPYGGVLIQRGGAVLPSADWQPHPGAVAASVADFDGDGMSDLLIAEEDGDLALRAGPAFDQPPTPLVLGGVATRIAAGDLDGDGDADVVMSTSDSVKILANTEAGLAEEGTGIAVATVALAVRDLDLDGKPDVVWLTDGKLEVRRNLGSFAFGSRIESTGPGRPLSLALGDFEGDGDLDIAATVVDSESGPATTTYLFENLVR